MTALEFLSHVHESHWLDVRNVETNLKIKCKVGEFEAEEYSDWHELTVIDWYMNDNGKIYLDLDELEDWEVQDV